jgi:2,3,4,5-tetrahydropyridine-2,6-dicarboxylate N-succinyltransferase
MNIQENNIMTPIESLIHDAFEQRASIHPSSVDKQLKSAIDTAIDLLDSGQARIAEWKDNTWQVNEWLKKAVLLFFKIQENQTIDAGYTQFYDKVPLKFTQYSTDDLKAQGVRIVPHAIVRKGAYIAPNTILMPSYVNIGAYIDSGTLVDTWATVGSCAQIGKNVHLSGGVGIGGVLEPLQGKPTIIEDNCFIGARSEIVEGVIVEKGSVISMGVYIGQSTKIYNRLTGEISYGRVPAGSVVVAGSLPSSDHSHSLYAAIIIKQVDEKTREKVSLNELLRDIPS